MKTTTYTISKELQIIINDGIVEKSFSKTYYSGPSFRIKGTEFFLRENYGIYEINKFGGPPFIPFEIVFPLLQKEIKTKILFRLNEFQKVIKYDNG